MGKGFSEKMQVSVCVDSVKIGRLDLLKTKKMWTKDENRMKT